MFHKNYNENISCKVTSWPSMITKCLCQRFILWMVYLFAEWKLMVIWASAKMSHTKMVSAWKLGFQWIAHGDVQTGFPWSDILLPFCFTANFPNSQMIFACKVSCSFRPLWLFQFKLTRLVCEWGLSFSWESVVLYWYAEVLPSYLRTCWSC